VDALETKHWLSKWHTSIHVRCVFNGLLKQLLNGFAASVGQPFLATVVQDSQFVLIQTELPENGRVQIANVAGTLDRSQPDFVSRTNSASTLNSTA